MGFLRFARQHIAISVGVVAGAFIAVFGAVSDGLDLYRAGIPAWAWLAIGLTVFFASVIVLLYRFNSQLSQPASSGNSGGQDADFDPDWLSKLQLVVGTKFRNQNVPVDGRRYLGCEFHNVTFVYNGGPFAFEQCTIGGHTIRTDDPRLNRFTNLLVTFGHIATGLQTPSGLVTLDQLDAAHGHRRDRTPTASDPE
ncbi:MAG: hypothetical protein ACT4N8_10150 [Sphingosinicella sp.]|uniref:hypothetical protein n=1 Tax=Sphingosinicella sp. TaxID=1917971 RepID=UPI004037C0B5